MKTLRIVHPEGHTTKTIVLPEGSTVRLAGQPLITAVFPVELEIVVPHDFATTQLEDE